MLESAAAAVLFWFFVTPRHADRRGRIPSLILLGMLIMMLPVGPFWTQRERPDALGLIKHRWRDFAVSWRGKRAKSNESGNGGKIQKRLGIHAKKGIKLRRNKKFQNLLLKQFAILKWCKQQKKHFNEIFYRTD